MRLASTKRESLIITLAVMAYVVSVVVNLGYLELSGEEPRRAMISIEMLHSGNYIQPTLLGWDYYNKPPVFNWILCVFIWVTGSASELVLRLPSLLFYLLMAIIHYWIARRYLPSTIAFLSSVFILTCGDVYFYGLANGAEIDIFYGLIVYLQAISIFWFFHKKQLLFLFLVSYFLCAVGFLTKGFPSILFQVLTLLALCVHTRSVKFLLNWRHLAGVSLFAGVLCVYFYLYSQYNSPHRYLTNLLNEAFLKSAIGERYHRLPEKAAMFPLLFLKMLVPWSLLLLLLFKKIKSRLWENPFVRFSILFILFNLWVYWFTGQPKIRYVYMFLPFACTVLAYIYYRFTEVNPGAFHRILRPFGFIFLAVALAVFILPFIEETSFILVMFFGGTLGILTYRYFFGSEKRMWLLIGGIILLRLMYAALFIPLQYKGLNNYQPIVQTMVKQTHGTPMYFKGAAVSMPIAVKNNFFHYNYDTVSVAPVLSYQVPYYYYLQTGRLMKFDTSALGSAFKFSYAYQLEKTKVNTLYSFFDWAMNGKAFLYR